MNRVPRIRQCCQIRKRDDFHDIALIICCAPPHYPDPATTSSTATVTHTSRTTTREGDKERGGEREIKREGQREGERERR